MQEIFRHTATLTRWIRPGAESPRIEVNSSVQRITVEIALPDGASGPYDVRLEANGRKSMIWSGTLMLLLSPHGDARLMFDVPARNIESGAYYFVVSSLSSPQASTKYYDFRVMLTK